MAVLRSTLADRSRATVKAYSYEHPIALGDGQRVWARNRRVELIFHDVADERELIELVRPLLQQPEST